MPHLYSGKLTVWTELARVLAENLVVDQGHDIVGHLLAGHGQYRISHMYFEFENTVGTPAPITPAATDKASDIHAIAAPRDIIRAPLAAVPVLSGSDVNHLADLVSFYAMTTDSVGLLHGLPFTEAANSKVYAICLVAAPGGSDYLQDLLYARASVSPAIVIGGEGVASNAWKAKVSP